MGFCQFDWFLLVSIGIVNKFIRCCNYLNYLYSFRWTIYYYFIECIMKKNIFLMLVLFSVSLGVSAHEWRTDKYGCHNVYQEWSNTSIEYHCHRKLDFDDIVLEKIVFEDYNKEIEKFNTYSIIKIESHVKDGWSCDINVLKRLPFVMEDVEHMYQKYGSDIDTTDLLVIQQKIQEIYSQILEDYTKLTDPLLYMTIEEQVRRENAWWFPWAVNWLVDSTYKDEVKRLTENVREGYKKYNRMIEEFNYILLAEREYMKNAVDKCNKAIEYFNEKERKIKEEELAKEKNVVNQLDPKLQKKLDKVKEKINLIYQSYPKKILKLQMQVQLLLPKLKEGSRNYIILTQLDEYIEEIK